MPGACAAYDSEQIRLPFGLHLQLPAKIMMPVDIYLSLCNYQNDMMTGTAQELGLMLVCRSTRTDE